ncbi:MAG: PepSY domain-containing protein, partial [Synergistaceae bacterium]|nr:PepSY domain-containing protein [Synergistaceae bacterium]
MREKTPGQFVRAAVIALALCALMSFSAIAAEKPSYIGLEAAKQIALKHAGVSANDATFTKAKLDRDDGVAEYNIRFTSNKIRYRYEIDAKTGAVLSQQKR